MAENLKVDKVYKEAFNHGYELTEELELKSPMFKDKDSDSLNISAIQADMDLYKNEKMAVLKNGISSIINDNEAKSSLNQNFRNDDQGLDFSL